MQNVSIQDRLVGCYHYNPEHDLVISVSVSSRIDKAGYIKSAFMRVIDFLYDNICRNLIVLYGKAHNNDMLIYSKAHECRRCRDIVGCPPQFLKDGLKYEDVFRGQYLARNVEMVEASDICLIIDGPEDDETGPKHFLNCAKTRNKFIFYIQYPKTQFDMINGESIISKVK
jgi:hypothetical protein